MIRAALSVALMLVFLSIFRGITNILNAFLVPMTVYLISSRMNTREITAFFLLTLIMTGLFQSIQIPFMMLYLLMAFILKEMNQALMKHRLTERGLAYDLAENGKEAVEMAIRHSYDLILMDIQMPLMDGLEATHQIRNNTEIPQPRIVAMTACSTLKDQEAFLAAGMDGFLTKPITTENLDMVLNNEG